MATDADLLTLAQWLSPAYPVGAFAYSHGLETLIARGQITSAATLIPWLQAVLTDGAGHNDAILLVAAYNADAGDLATLDTAARAFCVSSERLLETTQQGAAFCDTTRAVWGLALSGLTYPVAIGRAARLQGLPLDLTCVLFLQAVIGNLVAAAVRLVPLGQTEGQATLAGLAPLCRQVAEIALGQTPDDMTNHAFAVDIAAMHHETLTVRIFRT
jgi:urease accessory protein